MPERPGKDVKWVKPDITRMSRNNKGLETFMDRLRVALLGLPRRQKRLLQVMADVVLVWGPCGWRSWCALALTR